MTTYRFILLIKVVHVSVQDLDKQLDGSGSLHAGVRNTKSALQAFENTLAVSVELITYMLAFCSTATDGGSNMH